MLRVIKLGRFLRTQLLRSARIKPISLKMSGFAIQVISTWKSTVSWPCRPRRRPSEQQHVPAHQLWLLDVGSHAADDQAVLCVPLSLTGKLAVGSMRFDKEMDRAADRPRSGRGGWWRWRAASLGLVRELQRADARMRLADAEGVAARHLGLSG